MKEGKGSSSFRPTVLTSSMRVIEDNFRIVRDMCGAGIRQIAVVKADAYGHGLLPVARRLLSAGAWGLAVATVDEAVTLRDAGVDAPILVLGGSCDGALREAVARGISQAVYDERALHVMQREAERLNRPALAHLKIDTGMSRIGARGEAAVSTLLEDWKTCPAVRMEGLFTHFAQADTDPVSHAGDPGDIVAAVAGQPFPVGDLGRRDASLMKAANRSILFTRQQKTDRKTPSNRD